MIVVTLPNERLRAEVIVVFGNGNCVARIDGIPIGKTHQFKSGEYILCKRKTNQIETFWEADNRSFQSLEDLYDALSAGEKPKGNKQKHKRANGKRKAQPKAGSSNRAGQSRKKPGLGRKK